MKLHEFRNKLEQAVRDYYYSQRISGDGSGMDKDVDLYVEIGQNNHDFCIVVNDDGIIVKILD